MVDLVGFYAYFTQIQVRAKKAPINPQRSDLLVILSILP